MSDSLLEIFYLWILINGNLVLSINLLLSSGLLEMLHSYMHFYLISKNILHILVFITLIWDMTSIYLISPPLTAHYTECMFTYCTWFSDLSTTYLFIDHVIKTTFPFAPLPSIMSLCAFGAWLNWYSCPTVGLRMPACSPAAIADVIPCFSL